MIKTLLRLLFVLGNVVAFSCDNSSTEPHDYYAYCPLKVGNYIVYNVREETYSAGKQEPTISESQEKDQIVGKVDNGDGTYSYLISRFTRIKISDYWTKTKDYRVTSAPDRILTNIDNTTFFTLIFPVDLNIRWNGNSYNTDDKEEYRYDGINEPYSVGGDNFQSTLTVVERMDSSIINKYTGVKKYALNVGLIYDDQISFEYCQTTECLESDIRKVESGSHKTRKLVEYGAVE